MGSVRNKSVVILIITEKAGINKDLDIGIICIWLLGGKKVEQLFNVSKYITLDDAVVVIYVLVLLVAIEGGIIAGLATRAGSIRNLFRLTSAIANKRSHNATNKHDVASKKPKIEESLE